MYQVHIFSEEKKEQEEVGQKKKKKGREEGEATCRPVFYPHFTEEEMRFYKVRYIS